MIVTHKGNSDLTFLRLLELFSIHIDCSCMSEKQRTCQTDISSLLGEYIRPAISRHIEGVLAQDARGKHREDLGLSSVQLSSVSYLIMSDPVFDPIPKRRETDSSVMLIIEVQFLLFSPRQEASITLVDPGWYIPMEQGNHWRDACFEQSINLRLAIRWKQTTYKSRIIVQASLIDGIVPSS